MKTPFWFVLLGCCLSLKTLAQTLPLGFQYQNPPNLIGQGNTLPYLNAWAGGMNAPQIQESDLNQDGQKELIVFDRSGNAFSVYETNNNRQSWSFSPDLTKGLPVVFDWFIVRDYDQDGLDDIFTSAGNGIKVFKRLPNLGNIPQFTEVNDILLSSFNGEELNLFVSRVDIPAIEDIDFDGDLDILTFYILGTCLEYHRNMSQELFGHSDSLKFKLESDNWGLFTEDPQNNAISYNDSCFRGGGDRHSGSTLLADNLDQDNDMDLLLGDVSFSEALFLINQPNNGFDQIIPTPQQYPQAWNDVEVVLFPGLFRIQSNPDTLPDLIIAPNTDNNSLNSGRLMKRYPGQNSQYHFTGPEQPFLINDMLDLGKNSFPALSDLDADGDLDLLVGTGGEFELPVPPSTEGNYRAACWLFENIGTNTSPSFRFKSNDVGGLRTLNQKHLAPACGDLNNDGLPDIIVGLLDGKFKYLRNLGNLTFSEQSNLEADAADFSTPVLFDMNNDSKLDLISGCKQGYFKVFFNIGNIAEPAFSTQPDIDQWSNAETIEEGVSNFSYSSPSLIISGNDTLLFSGSERGVIMAWRFTSGNQLVQLDSIAGFIDCGRFSSLAIGDLNSDGFPDMICGNQRGGLNWFQGTTPTAITPPYEPEKTLIFPNPNSGQFTLKGNVTNTSIEQLRIFDITGRNIPFQASKHQNTINFRLQQTTPGVYFLQGAHNGISRIIVTP